MINLFDIFGLIWYHFLADFILQNDKMALNKSKSIFWLFTHSSVYCIPFCLWGFKFAIFNGILHFVIDGISSRITSKLYPKESKHWFFVVIGLDQAIHLTCLISTFIMLNP